MTDAKPLRMVAEGKPRTRAPLSERLWRRAVIMDNGCWQWTGYTMKNGYGLIEKHTLVHRLAYELTRGPIPEGLDLDHLCKNRACLNPDHLEAVTRRVNLLRGAHPNMVAARTDMCRRGLHPLSGDNLYVQPDGRRNCVACRQERTRRS